MRQLMFLGSSEVAMAGIRLAGIDLAWHGVKPSGVALGRLHNDILQVDYLTSEVFSNDELCRKVQDYNAVGVAIDAPLVIKNQTGMRECERQIGTLYGNKGASCHTANLSLFPKATSVQLSDLLQKHHYEHIVGTRWQIEVYPHPAIIELFKLDYRLAYKKGKVAERKAGQVLLASYLQSLGEWLPFSLQLAEDLAVGLNDDEINKLKGEQLKQNEDKLDALVCLVIASLHLMNQSSVVGDDDNGYIVLPNGASKKVEPDENIDMLEELSLKLFVVKCAKKQAKLNSKKRVNPDVTESEREDWYKKSKKLKDKVKKLKSAIASLENGSSSESLSSQQKNVSKNRSSGNTGNFAASYYLAWAFLNEYPHGVFVKHADESIPHFYGFVQKFQHNLLYVGTTKIEVDDVIEQESITASVKGKVAKTFNHRALETAFYKVKRALKGNNDKP